MKIKFILTIALIFVISALNAQSFPKLSEIFRLKQLQPPTGKIRMILDTDTYNEVDDQFALAYALLSPEKIVLEAVYAAPFFNNRSENAGDGMGKSYEEILRLLKFMGKSPEDFAFRGSDRYLENIDTPIKSSAALDLINKAKASSPENPLYVVTIGCITNIASAILIEPEIIKNIVVVWLGGNSLDWPTQGEFNLVQDVLAAQVVFNSGVPLVTLPCNPVVSHFKTTVPELKYYLEGKNDLADYLFNIVKDYGKGRDAFSKVIWDVTAIAWLVNPSWIPTNLVHSPILTDQVTFSIDRSRHFIIIVKTTYFGGGYV
jgi:inosine-uridine nucleoside N-ribohydrolase